MEGSPFWRGAIACTGTEFCKLAITETKGFTRWLVDELEERLPEFDQQLQLHVTGCPNSCGQHWIADIGLEGKKIKHEGRMTDAYYFCVGGRLGNMRRRPGQLASARRRTLCRKLWSGCCGSISRSATMAKICVLTLRATRTPICEWRWPAKNSNRSNGICPAAAFR